MIDAEFFAELTGGQNDFARAVEALRATGRAFCLKGICESHPRIIPLIPSGLIPEVDQLRDRS